MKTPVFFAALILCEAALTNESFAMPEPSNAPNILFIMSDDHTARSIGAYQYDLAEINPTPNLDRLANEGALFSHVYCDNSICCPSRASILTGQHSQSHGVLTLDSKMPHENQRLPNTLGEAGYDTAIIGKWHLKDEPSGYQYYKVLAGHGGQGEYFNPTFYERDKGTYGEELQQSTGHSTDVITDEALAWFERRDTSKPFFLSLHYKAPHDMFENAPRYDSYLEDIDLPYAPGLFDPGNHGSVATRGVDDELRPYIGTSVGRRHQFRAYADIWSDPEANDDEAKKQAYQTYLKKYLRCVKGIDDNVGRVYDYLEANDLLDNTIIVYTSDQGMWLGEHDYQDKRWMYEESMRMPFIMRYPPAIEAGSSVNTLINNTDFAPTLFDFAGIETPEVMHGRSFKPVLLTGKAPEDWRTATYHRYWYQLVHHFNPAHFGLRTQRYKLIFFYGLDHLNPEGRIQTPPGWEFYDLKNDPDEMNNLYGDPEYAQIIAELKDQLKALREEFNETDKNYPHIQEIIDAHWETTEASQAEAARISKQARIDFDAALAAETMNGLKAGAKEL
ncbi:sulfatase [Rubellicoccus peritrichatus]|uniref:Sulfatase n=1 Tax=Rubellicoccus peritrichatus TaxID=3080537 RepID=A0AAQ3QR18_9BACT|nr:sulfatase [Puniceicoccus sp. CR14]WOO40853.1 sulfatase [Puniceicoccus sp. CR14]